MFERLRVAYRRWRSFQQVRELDKLIQHLIPHHRYDVETRLKRMGYTLRKDASLEEGTVFTAIPDSLVLHLNARSMASERRTAMSMYLVHLTITLAGQELATPYIVYDSDLLSKEGPSDNTQWLEYMQAMDILLPHATYVALAAVCPHRCSYVIQRVMEVNALVIEQRTMAFARHLPPVTAINITLPHPSKRITK